MSTWVLHGDFSQIELLPAKQTLFLIKCLNSCASSRKNEAVPSFSVEAN